LRRGSALGTSMTAISGGRSSRTGWRSMSSKGIFGGSSRNFVSILGSGWPSLRSGVRASGSMSGGSGGVTRSGGLTSASLSRQMGTMGMLSQPGRIDGPHVDGPSPHDEEGEGVDEEGDGPPGDAAGLLVDEVEDGTLAEDVAVEVLGRRGGVGINAHGSTPLYRWRARPDATCIAGKGGHRFKGVCREGKSQCGKSPPAGGWPAGGEGVSACRRAGSGSRPRGSGSPSPWSRRGRRRACPIWTSEGPNCPGRTSRSR